VGDPALLASVPAARADAEVGEVVRGGRNGTGKLMRNLTSKVTLLNCYDGTHESTNSSFI